MIGVYGPTGNLVPIGNVLNKGLTLRGSQCNVKRYLPRLFEHIKAGILKPSDVITHRASLDDVAEAYHLFSQKKQQMIKPILLPRAAA